MSPGSPCLPSTNDEGAALVRHGPSRGRTSHSGRMMHCPQATHPLGSPLESDRRGGSGSDREGSHRADCPPLLSRLPWPFLPPFLAARTGLGGSGLSGQDFCPFTDLQAGPEVQGMGAQAAGSLGVRVSLGRRLWPAHLYSAPSGLGGRRCGASTGYSGPCPWPHRSGLGDSRTQCPAGWSTSAWFPSPRL